MAQSTRIVNGRLIDKSPDVPEEHEDDDDDDDDDGEDEDGDDDEVGRRLAFPKAAKSVPNLLVSGSLIELSQFCDKT